MKVLVTGAAGFLGARLIRMLLAGGTSGPQVTAVIAADLAPCPVQDPRVSRRVGTIADADFIDSLVDAEVTVVYHLAAVLSGQSEAEFDVGMQINVDATRSLLEACRRVGTSPRCVFASSVSEDMALVPQSSYGTEKAIAELMVSDYSRRGFIDGISCRLPTVAIRPGRPNSALSSFVSGIIREPLAGIEAVCPVPLHMRLWITSPDVVTTNLVHASVLATSRLQGKRSVNFPGLSVTPAEMLDSLARLGGPTPRSLVRCQEDEAMMRIVGTWPGAFDVSRALRLGFVVDRDVDSVIRQFQAEQSV